MIKAMSLAIYFPLNRLPLFAFEREAACFWKQVIESRQIDDGFVKTAQPNMSVGACLNLFLENIEQR